MRATSVNACPWAHLFDFTPDCTIAAPDTKIERCTAFKRKVQHAKSPSSRPACCLAWRGWSAIVRRGACVGLAQMGWPVATRLVARLVAPRMACLTRAHWRPT